MAAEHHHRDGLEFNVNRGGHVAGAPRDAYFRIYVVPSLDLVVYKIAGWGGWAHDTFFLDKPSHVAKK